MAVSLSAVTQEDTKLTYRYGSAFLITGLFTPLTSCSLSSSELAAFLDGDLNAQRAKSHRFAFTTSDLNTINVQVISLQRIDLGGRQRLVFGTAMLQNKKESNFLLTNESWAEEAEEGLESSLLDSIEKRPTFASSKLGSVLSSEQQQQQSESLAGFSNFELGLFAAARERADKTVPEEKQQSERSSKAKKAEEEQKSILVDPLSSASSSKLTDLVYSLSEPLSRHSSRTGGKGASLAILSSLSAAFTNNHPSAADSGTSFKVPGGVIVTTNAYAYLLKECPQLLLAIEQLQSKAW